MEIVFLAMESEQARSLEPKFSISAPAISTGSAFCYQQDVPILIPGVDSEHAALLKEQKKTRNWKGSSFPIPTAPLQELAITLKPIYDVFGIRTVIMTSMQAMSGAGRSASVLGMDILDNVIP